jgi:sec-independent protein translocase protein TatA
MPSLGPAEILVILVVALLVFGPDKMPEIGRQLARGVREFRRVQQHLSSELRNVAAEFDVDDADHVDDEATSSPTQPGGDPVPTLPAKKGDASDPTADASALDATGAPSRAASSSPPSPASPSDPQDPGTDVNGESPPAQPSDRA